MSGPVSFIPPETVAALGAALLHFLWQGTAIAVLAAAAMALCRRPQLRYLLGVSALAAMLAAPVFTVALLAQTGHFVPVTRMAAPVMLSLPVASAAQSLAVSPVLPSAAHLSWLVAAWLAGVILLSVRAAGGFWMLARRRKDCARPQPCLLALCHDLQRRMGIARAVAYLECGWLDAPAVIGVLRPALLLPVATLSGLSPQQLEMVIAHELAHIRRFDALVNLFQVLVETLLFFHPAVWWLNRRIRAEREYCCDEAAVSLHGDALAYARALRLMEEWRTAPAFSMAANHGSLAARVLHVLGRPAPGRVSLPGLVGALVLLACAAIGIGLLRQAAPPVADARRLPRVATLPAQPQAAAQETAPQTGLAPAPPRRVMAAAVRPVVRRDQIISVPPPVMAQEDAAQSPPAETAPQPQKIAAAYEPAGRGDGTAAFDRSTDCRMQAQDIVTSGANQPMVVDAALKQRFVYFYWRCMRESGQQTQRRSVHPIYAPIGAASPERPANAAGNWTIISGWSPAARTCTFSQDGNAIKGWCAGPEGDGAALGVVDGRQVRWTWNVSKARKTPLSDGSYRPGQIDFIGALRDGAMSGRFISPTGGPSEQVHTFGVNRMQLASR